MSKKYKKRLKYKKRSMDRSKAKKIHISMFTKKVKL